MTTQENNTITIEVLTPQFADTKHPFLVGDHITAVKVSKIEDDAVYYITPVSENGGIFRRLKANDDVFNGNNIYKAVSIGRYL